MTARQYIDEIKLRLTRIGVVTKINDAEILTRVNRSRRAIQMMAMPVFEQKFGAYAILPIATITADSTSSAPVNNFGSVANIYRVPLGFPIIDVISASIVWTDTSGQILRRECRKVAKREMNTVNYHAWNCPTIDRPIYALESKYREATPTQLAGQTLYLGGLEDSPATTILSMTNPSVELWYVAPLSDFAQLNELEAVLSPELEELAIQHTMLGCLSNYEYIALKQTVQTDFDLFKNVALSNFSMMTDTPIHTLPSEGGF